MPRSFNTWWIQHNFVAVVARVWYSNSVEERETMSYFLALQVMGLKPRYTKKPVVERRLKGWAQSEFEKAKSDKGPGWKKMPKLGVLFTYLRICLVATKWASHGADMNWQTWCTCQYLCKCSICRTISSNITSYFREGRGVIRGGGMHKGGGPWPPQNSEFFKNIYTIILIFLKFSLQK